MQIIMSRIVIQKLQKDFRGKIAVDVNLTLENGIYGLLGENGAGKTTLMRLLSGLLKRTAGEILYNGKNIEKLGMAYRKVIGYLPQSFGYYEDYTAKHFLLYLAALKDL